MNRNIYLIITPTISNIGGSQIYSLNKYHFLEKKQYGVFILHANIGDTISIEEMKVLKKLGVDEFKFPSYFFSSKKNSELIEKIIRKLQILPSDSVIIESHTITCATWGEILASELRAKHFVYLLSEYPKIGSRGLYEFLKFKYYRKELAGISNKSLRFLFKDYIKIEEDKNYSLSATCSNVLDDVQLSFSIPYENYDYIIASIGRIDKPYIIDSIDDIIRFSDNVSNKNVLLVLIGGGSNRVQKLIRKKIKNRKNIGLYITGNIYPIPISLIKIPNVFLTTAGSCNVSDRIGKITISFDVNDLKPIGIYHQTTNNTTYRDKNEPILSLYDLLNDVLINKVYHETLRKIDIKEINNIDFTDHINFILSGEETKMYYDISQISKSFRDKVRIICIKMFGINLFFKIKKIKK